MARGWHGRELINSLGISITGPHASKLLHNTQLQNVVAAVAALQAYTLNPEFKPLGMPEILVVDRGRDRMDALGALSEPPQSRTTSIIFMQITRHRNAITAKDGIDIAMKCYKALRFVQTQVYGTGHMFYTLFTAPGTNAAARDFGTRLVGRLCIYTLPVPHYLRNTPTRVHRARGENLANMLFAGPAR